MVETYESLQSVIEHEMAFGKYPEGIVLFIRDQNKYYHKQGYKWVEGAGDQTPIIDTGMTVYEWNKKMAQDKPVHKTEERTEDKKIINEFHKKNNNIYYMLYCNDIGYMTLFEISVISYPDFHTLGDGVLDCLAAIHDVYEEEGHIEIFADFDDDIHCFFLFPYDAGIIKVGE